MRMEHHSKLSIILQTLPCIVSQDFIHTTSEVMIMKHETRNGTASDQDFDIDIQACSTMELTGLMHAAPIDDAEVEHYNQLYKFLPEHDYEPEK